MLCMCITHIDWWKQLPMQHRMLHLFACSLWSPCFALSAPRKVYCLAMITVYKIFVIVFASFFFVSSQFTVHSQLASSVQIVYQRKDVEASNDIVTVESRTLAALIFSTEISRKY